MQTTPVRIEIFTIPQAACDSGKANWQQAAQMVSRQLEIKFGEAIYVKHIEFMSAKWFEHARAQKLLEKGEINFPFVLVNGEIACADKKINVPKIKRVVQEHLNEDNK